MKNGHISRIRIAIRLLAIAVFASVFITAGGDPGFLNSLNVFWPLSVWVFGIGYFLSIWFESRDDSNTPKTRALWLATLLLQLLPLLALFASGIMYSEGGLGLLVIFAIFGLPLVFIGFIMMVVNDTKALLLNRKHK